MTSLLHSNEYGVRLEAVEPQVVVRQSRHFPGYSIAKSSISIHVPELGEFTSHGFGCGKSSDLSVVKARSEAIERLLFDLWRRDDRVSSKNRVFIDWPTYAISTLPNWFVAHDDRTTLSDGTGCSSFGTLRGAVEHALLEIAEREILYRVWNEESQIFPIKTKPSAGVPIRTYCISYDIPFTLAVIHDPLRGILVVGSAVRQSLLDAATAAREESIMLYESVAQGENPVYRSAKKSSRYASLNSDASKDRAKYLASLSKNRDFDNQRRLARSFPKVQILRTVFGESLEAGFIFLGRSFGLFSVLANVHTARVPQDIKDSNIPSHPFC